AAITTIGCARAGTSGSSGVASSGVRFWARERSASRAGKLAAPPDRPRGGASASATPRDSFLLGHRDAGSLGGSARRGDRESAGAKRRIVAGPPERREPRAPDRSASRGTRRSATPAAPPRWPRKLPEDF